jgi:hypothetical protein
MVTTSPLVLLDTANKLAGTKNTTYELGEPDPHFVEFVKTIQKELSDYDFKRVDVQQKKRAV